MSSITVTLPDEIIDYMNRYEVPIADTVVNAVRVWYDRLDSD